MPRPAARKPATLATDEPTPALAAVPDVAPAPRHGAHYGERRTPRRPPKPAEQRVANYPQLGTRIAPDLYAQLLAACQERGLRQSYVVSRGLQLVLEELGYEVDRH